MITMGFESDCPGSNVLNLMGIRANYTSVRAVYKNGQDVPLGLVRQ